MVGTRGSVPRFCRKAPLRRRLRRLAAPCALPADAQRTSLLRLCSSQNRASVLPARREVFVHCEQSSAPIGHCKNEDRKFGTFCSSPELHTSPHMPFRKVNTTAQTNKEDQRTLRPDPRARLCSFGLTIHSYFIGYSDGNKMRNNISMCRHVLHGPVGVFPESYAAAKRKLLISLRAAQAS